MSNDTEKRRDRHGEIWAQYQHGLAYQNAMGFTDAFPRYVRFKEGDQWPPATERTKNMPRPVFNVCDMFVRTKRSSVLNQPIAINYSPAEISGDPVRQALAAQGASDLTDYAKQLWKRMRQDQLNAEVVDDAATLGTGVYHYYYDLSVTGGLDTVWRGEIRGESIDPLNIFFANPQIRDVQRQPWIIIAQRVTVRAARQLAERYGVSKAEAELIRGDAEASSEGYDAAQREVDGEDKLTLLTKYHRDKDGSVIMTRGTQCVTLCEDVPITPDGSAARITRYPIAVFNWYIKKKCAFGIGEVQSMIPAQKAINFLKGMELLSAQQTAWPKLVVKPGALQNQAITNSPGETITDYYGGGNGIYYLNPPAMSMAASALAESIMSLMRTTAGVNEATTGESMGGSMAASAIIALQAQAKSPIEEIQKRYWLCIEDVGAIWQEMIKAYYTDERSIRTDPVAGQDEQRRVFVGSAYADIDYDMTIDVGASSEYGEVLSQSTLDRMLDRGDITIDQYVELAPRNVVPFKETFKQMREQSGQAAQAMQEQAMMMAQSGMLLPGVEAPAPDAQTGGIPAGPDTPTGISQPAGVGGVPLPPIPTAPQIRM